MLRASRLSAALSSVACLLTLLLLATAVSWAQSDRASMTGTVKDPSGAVVPEAKVRITNVDTNGAFETDTDGAGHYATLPVLKPGQYKVEVSHAGFKKATSGAITLQIGEVRVVDITLTIGAATENITVTGEAPLVETETSSRGGVITGRQVTDLPLRDRNFTQLATLNPGVVRTYSGILSDAQQLNQGDPNAGTLPGGSDPRGSTESARFSRSGGADISANGLRPTQNNFTLDGVDNNEPQFGTIGVFPNPDAIQEFKVETSVAKAETGRGGATINTTYQSGTNAFHGSVYYYGQNDALNATHPSILRNRDDLVAGGLTPAQAEAQQPKSIVRAHEFGATFGGPIIKNRTFFFVDYLGQRNKLPNAFSTTVPTAKSRIGDFSEFSTQIFDPATAMDPNTPCGTNAPSPPFPPATPNCTPFAGNIIPNLQARTCVTPAVGCFSPQAFALLALYPLPTINVIDPGQFNPNFFGVRGNQETINTFDVKIDQRISDKNNLSGRYTRDNQERDRANEFPKVPTAGFGAGNEIGNTRQIVVSDTHTFSSHVLNEARFGWTHVDIGIFNCGVGGACGISPTVCTDLGIPNCNHGTLASSGGILTGAFNTGFFEFTGDGGLFDVKSNNFFVSDSVSVISGKHTWKMGAQIRPRLLDTIDGGRSGGLKGNLGYGSCPYCGPSDTGNGQANMLLQVPPFFANSGAIKGGDLPFNLRTTEWSFFVQDDWKATSNLTLNLGLRYDIFPSWREVSGRMADYDPATNTITQAGSGHQRLINTQDANVGPRVGFAYSFGPTRSMVVRGGYGLFYAVDGTDYPPLIRNPPLTSSVSKGASPTPPNLFNLTTGPAVPPITDPPVITPSTVLFVQPTHFPTETIHEWNLTWQWGFARDYVLDVGYVGTRGRHLLANRELGSNNRGLGLATATSGCLPPNCFIGNVSAYEDRGNSTYDGLQARVLKRFSHGVQGSVAYTYSHALDDSSGSFFAPGDNRQTGTGGGPTPINPFDFSRDRGNSSIDRRHVLVGNLIWDLPFGRGKRFGSNAGEGWDHVIGGWQMNLIFNAQSGQPFSVVGNGTVGVLLPGVNPFTGGPPGSILNPAAFAVESPCLRVNCNPLNPLAPGFAGTTCVTNLAGNPVCFGNTRRNQFTGPSYARTDLSFFKTTKVTERVSLQFGLAMFNLFNHDNGVVPQNDVRSGTFGQFKFGTSGVGTAISDLPPRTMQYRLKIIF